jgi:hypothetical protein
MRRLRLGRSDTAVEGQRVLVIGNPTGLQGIVSDGLIAAFRQNHSLIQITARISPGSSFDDGRVNEGFIVNDIKTYDQRWPKRSFCVDGDPILGTDTN